MHVHFACLLCSELKLGMAPSDVLGMVQEAAALGKVFFAGQ